jgi:hypothetical protein
MTVNEATKFCRAVRCSTWANPNLSDYFTGKITGSSFRQTFFHWGLGLNSYFQASLHSCGKTIKMCVQEQLNKSSRNLMSGNFKRKFCQKIIFLTIRQRKHILREDLFIPATINLPIIPSERKVPLLLECIAKSVKWHVIDDGKIEVRLPAGQFLFSNTSTLALGPPSSSSFGSGTVTVGKATGA